MNKFSITNKKNLCNIFIKFVSFPSKLRDYIFNRLFSYLMEVEIRVFWSQIRIIGLDNIFFKGKFTAGRGLWLESIGQGKISIGSGVNFSDWVHVASINSILIGDGCLFGSKVLITDHNHGKSLDICAEKPVPPRLRKLVSKGEVILEDNVWLGDGVVILPGVRLGRNSIVAANSVVTCDIPPASIWGGAPATQIFV